MNILDFALNWILNWIIFRPDSMKKVTTSIEARNSAETIKIRGRFCSSPARLLIGIWVRSSCTDHLISNQNGFMIHWRAKDHAANKLNLVTNKSRNSIKPAIIFNLLLDGGQWRDDHRGHALKMHIMDRSKISMINIMISARAEDRWWGWRYHKAFIINIILRSNLQGGELQLWA